MDSLCSQTLDEQKQGGEMIIIFPSGEKTSAEKTSGSNKEKKIKKKTTSLLTPFHQVNQWIRAGSRPENWF